MSFTALAKTAPERPLSSNEATHVMREIAEGQASTADIVCLLRALNARKPTAEELTAFVTVLRERAVAVVAPQPNTICNCGTGGDGRGTINASTTAAFIISACGVPLAKHGNRSVSSRCGSTDCLAALGVRACAEAREAEALLATEGLCFLNAPDFHPGLRYAAEARSVLAGEGCKSMFNLLGPMLNPAAVRRQSMGVFAEDMVELVAETLSRTGTEFAYVLWGDGYDEFALTGTTKVAVVQNGQTRVETWTPADLGLAQCRHEDILGGDAVANAQIAEAILRGQVQDARADFVLANAAFGVSTGLEPHVSPIEAMVLVREAVSSGAAHDMLTTMRRKVPVHA